jgi:aminoglycoside phosphotransferase (APT) family kinase protein
VSEARDPVADLEAFLARRTPGASTVTISNHTPMVGGYNRLMSRFDADIDGQVRHLVARAKPPAGYPTVIDTDPDKEWAVLKWLSDLTDRDVPMPKALYYDADGSELGSKTIIVDYVDGESMLKRAKSADLPVQLAHADALADLAAAIHEIGVAGAPSALDLPTSWDSYIDGCIDAWRAVEAAHGESLPVFRYLARWLDDNRPPPAPLTLIHGELQASNIMVNSAGRLLAVDWEMARIGDPREDLGWSLFIGGVVQPPDFVGMDLERFCARYRAASDLGPDVVNPDTVRYFSILPQAGPFGLLLDMIGEPGTGAAAPISASYMVGLLMAAQKHWIDITHGIDSARPKEGVTA